MHLMHVHGAPGGRGPPEPMALVTIVLSIHLIAAARIAHKFRNWQSVRKLVNRRCFCTTVLALLQRGACKVSGLNRFQETVTR
jgi:hypothetical protein